MVMDRDDVDIDVHLLDAEQRCLARGHRMIETTVPAGTYTVVLDTWVDGSDVERSGPFQWIAVACDEDDAACQ